ncbi:DUF692 domain-containing protein [Streptomyces sedi]|uniref:DUF692 domain-containing protein n=1 Tax=Streptomyces sedi TaxID=555059 RepID=A0A5C4VAS8_9ACTN|nr:DUF692 domain-containing protein [Streptomyces sedi]
MGLGYRRELHDGILAHRDGIGWLEIVTDQFLNDPDNPLLETLRESFVLVAHGLEMSIGSRAPLDEEYLAAVAAVADAVDAPWVSDHLCFTREEGVALHNLTPVFRTPEHAELVAARVRAVEERLGRPFLVENISYYVDPPSEMTEPEFLTAVMERSGCGMLLDLNNVTVNAANHGFDPYAYLDALPLERVGQIHLAGNTPEGVLLAGPTGMETDRHDGPVGEDVFALLAYVADRVDLPAVMIERDQNFPEDFGEIADELRRTREVLAASGGAR